MKLIFLVEEASMGHLLAGLLPRILPDGVEYQVVAHSGKRDLELSIPRKLRGWNEPGDIRFVIVHDQDAKDCVELKKSLQKLCTDSRRPVLIRIACQELEAWYFGDTNALAAVYHNPKLKNLSAQAKYRIPDKIPNPKKELQKLIPSHQQITGAKALALYIDIGANTSASFQCFVQGVRAFCV